MVGKRLVFIAVLMAFVFLSASFVIAGFSVGKGPGASSNGFSIQTVYGPEFNISGWVNISFSNEPLNSIFEDSFGNSVSLKDALDANPSYEYTCIPGDCESNYAANSASASKVLTLNSGQEAIVGLKFTGDLDSVDSLSFNIASNAGASCGPSQLEVDILNDDEIEIINNKSTANSCSEIKTYGCFNTSLTAQEFTLNNNNPYCEAVNLSQSPKVQIGAWIKNNSLAGTGSITAELFKTEGATLDSKGTCNLQATSSEGKEESCEVDYMVSETGKYRVCVYSNSQGTSYKVKGYDSSNSCGYFNDNPGADYQIFAQGKEFDSFGSSVVSNALPTGETLNGMVAEYIQERYGSDMSCGTQGCTVPIRIKSNTQNQEITLSSLSLVYTKTTGQTTDDKFYDVTETPAIVSSGFGRLYLNNLGLTVPDDLDEHDFILELNNQQVFNETIEVKDAPIIKSLVPLETASAYPTEFTLKIESKSKVTKVEWNFGDNSPIATTTGNKTTHTYNATGSYTLTVNVTDNKSISSSRSFEIPVALPTALIESRLASQKANINSVRNDISGLELFHKQGLESILNLSFAESELDNLEDSYEAATNESQYNAIITRLLQIDIPSGIVKTKQADNFVFFTEADNVDLDIIEEITNSQYQSSQSTSYRQAVEAWNVQNLQTMISFVEFSSEPSENTVNTEPIAGFFKIKASEKTPVSYPYYLIIPSQGITSQSSLSQAQGYSYTELRPNQEITFYATNHGMDFQNLPAVISPSFNRLTVIPVDDADEFQETSNLGIIIFAIVLLVIIAIIAYIIMQEWYKRKYEGHLFKNRNDLYNMVNYVNNAKAKGLSNSEIEKNLEKAGWGSEKIRYVMRKYAGKRTGMFEIPVDKIIKKTEEKR